MIPEQKHRAARPFRFARSEHILLVTGLMLLSGLFVHYDILWRWNNLLYDTQLSFWSRQASDDIVIINIDDESLNELGRWPWPRSTHASLLNRLDNEAPRVVGLDIIFSEADYNSPLSDVLLARAMRKSGNVVLPVFMTQKSSNAYPIEALPLPEFTNNAAALGHVHIDTSADGIARTVYLKEGIGRPHWPHYSLAILDVGGYKTTVLENVLELNTDYSALQWAKEIPYLIPYAGPPKHFQHIGYSQVMAGDYPKDLFRDKIVLIGATAEGLGDILPTPLPGSSGSMPGVEVIANIIDGLLNNIYITVVNNTTLLIITVLLVALPVLIYPYVNPAKTLLVLISALLATVLLVTVLMLLFQIWLPVATVLLFQLISYPLWSWRRLAQAMQHINAELDSLSSRQHALSIRRSRHITEELRFIAQFLPIKGWVIKDRNNYNLLEEGAVPQLTSATLPAQGWHIDGYRYWANIFYRGRPCKLGLSMGVDAVVSDTELKLLDGLIDTPSDSDEDSGAFVSDVFQAKIQQVQTAGQEYEELRRIIDDSLSGMADGVLICSSRGQILLSNQRAAWYLFGDDDAVVDGHSLSDALQPLRLQGGDSWQKLLERVLFNHERITRQVQHEEGRDILVQISPLRIIGDPYDGFIINLSDISLLMASEHKRNEVLNFLSHDLRSPLSSMIAMIELARNKSGIDELRDMLDSMETNTNKTLHLAEQFLQLSRANTNETINFFDIDFNSVVLNAIDQLWALSNKAKVTIHYRFQQEELWTHAEPDLLERAVVNLLSNAVKHSEAGDSVNVGVTLEQEQISCCVIDQGSGIPLDDLPHLFEMFKRSKSNTVERKPGIGLGLAFVDAVAKRHQGHVDVTSEEGVGSSFCLIFPRVEPTEPIE